MRVVPSRRADRGAFTLVELLTVIAIIVVLMGLLISAVMKGYTAVYRAANFSDINQLNTALVNFMATNKVSYIPSRLHLSETNQYIMSKQLDVDSVTWLKAMFPRADFTTDFTKNPSLSLNGGGYDWNGDGQVTTGAGGEFYLEGDQCLVFALGGIPIPGNTPGCSGFSAMPTDPTYHTRNTPPGTVNKPLFEFHADRLASLPHPLQTDKSGNPTTNGFYSYVDYYRDRNKLTVPMPYMFFSSYGKTNNYNRYWTLASPTSDCNAQTGVTFAKVWPYAEAGSSSSFPTLRYLKPDGFQIISAGADGSFGPGSDPTKGPSSTPLYWTPATADSYGSSFPAGKDDQSNFYTLTLGFSP